MMDWTTFRDHFPVTKHWVLLDHAAVAAPPSVCAEAIADWAHDKSINGVSSVIPWYRRSEETRSHAARLLNSERDDICFVGSTSHGISLVAEGFPWKAGDNVVLASEEYPANQYPWMNLRDKGVETRSVPSRGSRLEPSDLFDAMDSKTRVLTISSVEFASGFRSDLMTLGEECRRRGIFFFVDAIQSLGAFPLDASQLPIDALAADSHKWLLGPEGAGVAYLRREWIDRFHTTGVGWNSVVNPLEFSSIDFRLKPHAGRFEGGTQNIGGLVGMGESLKLLLQAGIDRIAGRILELTDYLCEQAPSAGMEVFSSRQEKEKSGIVSLLTPGRSPKDLMQACRDQGILVNVRGGRLRVSPHAYNTIDEIDRFLAVVRTTK
jgi:cysteine desulfurase/selenocysteine lyase